MACGPGSVVCAFARRVRRAVGLDATEAMLAQARRLAVASGVDNVAWHRGDVYALPFADGVFDVVSCRFAMHHLQHPAKALAEMVRVCRCGGRVVVCDAVASDDASKAAAFNAMERHRDPSTVEFRPLGFLLDLFRDAGLPEPTARFYQVPAERDRLLAASFPANDDRALLRAMIDASPSTATPWASTPAATAIRSGSTTPRSSSWRSRAARATPSSTSPSRGEGQTPPT